MRTVYWLSQHFADVPAGSAWLSEVERGKDAGLRVPKRRADWRLGRWTAKRAISALRACWTADARRPEELARAEVRPATSGVPEAFWDGERVRRSLSISHAAGRALVAVGPPASGIGCDIERVEPRSAAFLEDSFTTAERDAIAAAREPEVLSTLFWSAKESVLKALGQGLRLPLQGLAIESVDDSPLDSGWRALRAVEREGGRSYSGYWRRDGDFVLTIVGALPLAEPVALS